MNKYYLVDSSNKIVREFATERGAKISNTRCNLNCVVVKSEDYKSSTEIVKNLITGKDIEIDVNTSHCCDPSSETYWSM